MLKIKNLSFSINNCLILDKINFKVEHSDFLSVVGPNGAGKSTLLKILCGLITNNYSGEVLLKDKNIKDYSRRQIAEIIAYIPQFAQSKIFAGYTVFEYLLTGRFHYISRLRGYNKKDIEIVGETLANLKIEKFKNRMLTTLSGGELQKVILGAALVQQSEIIMFDESATFLDLKYKLEFLQMTKRLIKSGKTIIFVTHNINEAIDDNTKILALKEGRQHYFGRPINFFDSELAGKVFDVGFKKIIIDDNDIYYLPVMK